MSRPHGHGANRVLLIGQLRNYDHTWLRADLTAGVTVAALIVPKNLSYAGTAGILLQNGLYAAAAGALIQGIFGSWRRISMVPSSGWAAVAVSAVLAAGISSDVDVASFVAGITLASGIVFLLFAVLRIGWITQFLSRAVVTDFLTRASSSWGDEAERAAHGGQWSWHRGKLPGAEGPDRRGSRRMRTRSDDD